ncbi:MULTISPECIES: MOSC domain-containing protein [unclassified Gordonia (in: high G+C Gram-positive bacteria)]|uniref:MOSC domain-containing protein n=1 Tax=unclassified Gordonia (in: high G+C Gram-positive bacteria) TaxID=2657482 RepID=UPI001F1086CA|nr:MOSC domain-containing protein [Gordonia sp. ABSL49_1]MCH5645288.1 MOSC domain-containing protein [Gordonia sp. ABSL49_1]
MSVPVAGAVLAVCSASDDVVLDRVGASAIDKRPHADRVHVGSLGLGTDHVCDTKHHGGVDQAVYAYDDAEARRWADELGRELPYGWFGENLRVNGLPVTDAVVGERWQIGDDGLILETTIPRIPCRTFAAWAEEPRWVKRFLDRGDTGTYLRVHSPGSVGAGDTITVIHRPDHGVLVRHLLPTGTTADADALHALLSTDDLAPKVRRDAEKRLASS